jgi:hypothetical protein
LTAALCLHGGAAFAVAEYKIVTANEKGTYFAIGADLAKFVAPDAAIRLEVPRVRPRTSSIFATIPVSNSPSSRPTSIRLSSTGRLRATGKRAASSVPSA